MPRSSMRTEANEDELKSLPLSPSITSTSISTEDDPCHTHFAPDPPLLSLIDFSLVTPNVMHMQGFQLVGYFRTS